MDFITWAVLLTYMELGCSFNQGNVGCDMGSFEVRPDNVNSQLIQLLCCYWKCSNKNASNHHTPSHPKFEHLSQPYFCYD